MNYLIFRNDRIGDFFITAPLIKAIKRNDKKSKITVVCSEKNIQIIRKLRLIDECLLFENKNFIKRFEFFLKLKKYNFDNIIVADKKNRSLIFNLFLKSNNKIINVSKRSLFILLKFFYKNVFWDNDDSSQNITDILKLNTQCLGYEMINEDFKFLKDNEFEADGKIINFVKKLENKIIIHIDEKWELSKYKLHYKKAQNLTEIVLDINILQEFLDKVASKQNHTIIITTGTISVEIINELISKSKRIGENIYKLEIKGKNIYILNKTTFLEMVKLISFSKSFISCHGSFTHIANNYNLKIVDIIEKEKNKHYKRITSHMKNYNHIYRNDFKNISNKIVNLL